MIFVFMTKQGIVYHLDRSVRVAERLALPTSDHGVEGLNPSHLDISNVDNIYKFRLFFIYKLKKNGNVILASYYVTNFT